MSVEEELRVERERANRLQRELDRLTGKSDRMVYRELAARWTTGGEILLKERDLPASGMLIDTVGAHTFELKVAVVNAVAFNALMNLVGAVVKTSRPGEDCSVAEADGVLEIHERGLNQLRELHAKWEQAIEEGR